MSTGRFEFECQLAKALGLPKHTRSFELRVAVGEPMAVKCEYFPVVDGIPQFAETIATEFVLVEKK